MSEKIFELDSSAIIYPFVATEEITHGYTMEADIDEMVDVDILKQAADNVCSRFPSLFVALKKVKRGYALKHEKCGSAFVMPRPDFINGAFSVKEGEKLIRIIYKANRVGIEVFHIVTDGYGAIVLLKSLLGEYFRLKGEIIPNECGVFSPDELPSEKELEDSFKAHYRKEHGTESRSAKYAFMPYNENGFEHWHYTELLMNAAELKAVAKQNNATMTEFVSALYLYSFYEMREKKGSKKPISIAVPMNLRSMFASETLRNFTLFFFAGVPEGEVTFETILERVKKDFKSGMDKDVIQRMININVAQQSMLIFRILPRVMKKLVLNIGFRLYGEKLYTSTLSNLGVFKIPDELDKHILAFRAVLGPVPINTIHSTMYCSKGIFGITFTSRLAGREIENKMKELLQQQGIKSTLRDEEALLPIT